MVKKIKSRISLWIPKKHDVNPYETTLLPHTTSVTLDSLLKYYDQSVPLLLFLNKGLDM